MQLYNKGELIEVLSWYGEVQENYSGRGMYGKTCVGVVLDNANSIYDIMSDLAERENRMPAPSQDSMGLSTIFYWPRIQYEDE